MFPGSHLAVFSVSAAIALAVISDGVALAQNNKLQNNVSQNSAPQSSAPLRQSKAGGAAADVARGKYLVEDVAVCGQCHTPRDSKGTLDRHLDRRQTSSPSHAPVSHGPRGCRGCRCLFKVGDFATVGRRIFDEVFHVEHFAGNIVRIYIYLHWPYMKQRKRVTGRRKVRRLRAAADEGKRPWGPEPGR